MVQAISSRGEFNDAIQTDKLVVVDFTATWCPPCRVIAPFFAELSEKYPDVLFLKVDVDAQSDIAAEYGVRAMPTFKFLRGGNVIAELVGGRRQELENKVQQLMVVAHYNNTISQQRVDNNSAKCCEKVRSLTTYVKKNLVVNFSLKRFAHKCCNKTKF